jgi:hypothetical protein
MEAVRISEMSVNFNVTIWCYILEDSKLHTRRRENLKSHILSSSSRLKWSVPNETKVFGNSSAQLRNNRFMRLCVQVPV